MLPSARVGSEAMYFLAPAMEMAPAGSSIARESSKQSRTWLGLGLGLGLALTLKP